MLKMGSENEVIEEDQENLDEEEEVEYVYEDE